MLCVEVAVISTLSPDIGSFESQFDVAGIGTAGYTEMAIISSLNPSMASLGLGIQFEAAESRTAGYTIVICVQVAIFLALATFASCGWVV